MVVQWIRPKKGRSWLAPGEILRRLRCEFDHVRADSDEGVDKARERLPWLIEIGLPEQSLLEFDALSQEAVKITLTEGSWRAQVFLELLVIPGEEIRLALGSLQRDLARRCIEIIGYGVSRQRVDRGKPMEASKRRSLHEILERLERHRQRATFGALAGALGCEPLALLDGYPPTPRTSWAVNRSTGMPTNHHPDEIHPDLFQKVRVISKAEDIQEWLATRG